MEVIKNLIEKQIIFVDPTLQEMAEYLDSIFPEEEYGDFKIILEWSENS